MARVNCIRIEDSRYIRLSYRNNHSKDGWPHLSAFRFGRFFLLGGQGRHRIGGGHLHTVRVHLAGVVLSEKNTKNCSHICLFLDVKFSYKNDSKK